MSKSDKKNAEYAAQVEANLSRLYQNYLDRLNEKTGRQITKEDSQRTQPVSKCNSPVIRAVLF